MASLVFLAMAGLAACGGDAAPSRAAGRIITIEVSPLLMLDQAGHAEDGASYAVRPIEQSTEIVAARVVLHNPNATLVSILVDEQAAYLQDAEGNRFPPLDPWDRRVAVSNPLAGEETTAPLLWGELTLERGFEVGGWLLFDVPEGAEVTTFTWDQVDFIRLLLAQVQTEGVAVG